MAKTNPLEGGNQEKRDWQMQAFDGIRVLDLTHVLAGPFATYQLAVMGADVIKVEPLAGELNRQVGPVPELTSAKMGAHFQSQAANKRAITLDLKSDEGRAVFLDLARTSDVIVENYRAGAMERMGLGFDDIKAIRPDIIYCSITGFGQTGPKRGHGAFDNIIQAWSGMMEETGPADGDPVMIGPPLLDYGTGAQAAFAISAALLRRERTGAGQRIDVAMLDAAIAMQTCFALNHSATGRAPERSAMQGNYVAGYGCYRAHDGLIMLGAFTPAQHAALFRAIERHDLAEEVTDLSVPDMPARQAHDHAVLAEAMANRTAQEWEDHFAEAGVLAARVRKLDETMSSEQVASRPVMGSFASPELDTQLSAAMAAFSCDVDGPAIVSAPPRLGQHNDEVLRELGRSDAEIDGLRAKGVI
ncbi:MAG: CoA transferase [Pseudomonadota bacterium]